MRNIFYLLIFIVILFTTSCEKSNNTQAQNIWNVKDKFGKVDAASLQQALDAALIHRSKFPDADITVFIPEGTYYLNTQIALSGFNSMGKGWLILKGAGEGKTKLIDTEYSSADGVTFFLKNPYRFKLSDVTLEGEKLTSSQGKIDAVSNNNVTVTIDEGFPVMNELYETESDKANKLRLMQASADGNYHYVEGPGGDHYFYRWAFSGTANGTTAPKLLYGRTWQLTLHGIGSPPFKAGDKVGISSKSNRSNWGYFVGYGEDIVIENVTLLKLGRIKFRQGWKNIRFTNVKIIRPIVNGMPALYSTDAGPQFGQDEDNAAIENLTVENCDFRGTVDDATAFQRVLSGSVKNNYWEDGGGVLVGVNCGTGLVFANNTHIHCPLEDMRGQTLEGIKRNKMMRNKMIRNF